MKEIWKDIPEYEGLYQVSNLGNIKSLSKKRGRFIQGEVVRKLRISWDGYKYTTLYNKKRVKTYKIHRLVMRIFIGESNLEVNHKNGIKIDNRVENLEYVTRSENNLHKHRILGYKNNFQINHPIKGRTGILHHNSKKINQYDLSGRFIKIWNSISDIKRELGSIDHCLSGKSKTSRGFIWKYNILDLKT